MLLLNSNFYIVLVRINFMNLMNKVKSVAYGSAAIGLAQAGKVLDETKRILDSKSDLEMWLAKNTFIGDWLSMDKEFAVKFIDRLPEWSSIPLYVASGIAAGLAGHYLIKNKPSKTKDNKTNNNVLRGYDGLSLQERFSI